jgi:hypothetical protein
MGMQVSDSTNEDDKAEQELVLPITAEAYLLDVRVTYPPLPNGNPNNIGIDFGIIKVGDSSLKQITLENKGKYKVGFKFAPRSLLMQDLFTFIPMEGVLTPKGQLKV